MSGGQRGGSRTVVNPSFVDQSRYFSSKQLLIYPHEAEWTPYQTHCYTENLVAPGIEPRTSGSAVRSSDHRGNPQKTHEIRLRVIHFPQRAESESWAYHEKWGSSCFQNLCLELGNDSPAGTACSSCVHVVCCRTRGDWRTNAMAFTPLTKTPLYAAWNPRNACLALPDGFCS
jgi:hypothetical protein